MTHTNSRIYNEKIEILVRKRAREAMRRAATANLPFDKSFDDDSVLMVRKARYRCGISGRPFDIKYRTSGAGGTHYAPSPDRIVPEYGYVRGNVRWILWCLNRGKGEMSADHYLAVCRLVATYKAGVVTANAVEFSDIVNPTNRTHNREFTRQQIAAYRAHVTMARNAASGLTGNALAVALLKLARAEARLAAALAPTTALPQ